MTPPSDHATLPGRRPARPADRGAGPVEPGTSRRIAVPLGVLGAVVGGFAYVGAVDPNRAGHYPVCPLLYYTGVYCPGCGGLRSAFAVAHGQFGTAVGCNALAVAGYVLFAVVWVVWFGRSVRGRSFTPGVPGGWGWAACGVVPVFGIVRNLPFGAALAP